MADDHRYDWLDDDAVERLLGQAPATGTEDGYADRAADGYADGDARGTSPLPPEAAGLTELLRSLTPPPAAPDAVLPGEEAALAAFRAAHAAVPAAPSPTRVDAGAAGGAGVAEKVRGALGRWRPVKVAVAMAVAGCALGGVAVAAGTGVLSAPFGRTTSEPETSASVSALDDAGLETPLPPSGGPGASPSPGRSGAPRASEGPHAPGAPAPGGGPTPGHGGRDDRSTDGLPTPSRRDDGRDDNNHQGDDDGGDDRRGGTAWAARLCRDFLTTQRRSGGGVDEREFRDLQHTAGAAGTAAIRTYCEHLLGDDGRQGGNNGRGNGNGNDRPSRLLPHAAVPQRLLLPDAVTPAS
ncbi:hypothetical protein [Streptomyces sp. UNOC14_S4]|uniref:hypothetical protein n=1 Tax=Streptomyces sp. UNOC14_S4 TaxID=2872340 RepID=UPI001E58BC19|nr:hypothetical protein [Streptomyces sp. UNOC14_S4]MCC3771258.1 hypothetical protein [Streptomyces sp. UNOC14_S4]